MNMKINNNKKDFQPARANLSYLTPGMLNHRVDVVRCLPRKYSFCMKGPSLQFSRKTEQ